MLGHVYMQRHGTYAQDDMISSIPNNKNPGYVKQLNSARLQISAVVALQDL